MLARPVLHPFSRPHLASIHLALSGVRFPARRFLAHSVVWCCWRHFSTAVNCPGSQTPRQKKKHPLTVLPCQIQVVKAPNIPHAFSLGTLSAQTAQRMLREPQRTKYNTGKTANLDCVVHEDMCGVLLLGGLSWRPTLGRAPRLDVAVLLLSGHKTDDSRSVVTRGAEECHCVVLPSHHWSFGCKSWPRKHPHDPLSSRSVACASAACCFGRIVKEGETKVSLPSKACVHGLSSPSLHSHVLPPYVP